MRSTTGQHYVSLDHVRALAALMVFSWHFLHFTSGYPVSFDYTPFIFPLSIFDEGHTGVALFMVLSGYLFAKLLDGKRINYLYFLWNRALRLLPLLLVVIFIVGVQKILNQENLASYVKSIVKGVVLPTLPNGGWSITAEFHFYLVLPLLLYFSRKSPHLPILVVIAAIACRAWFFIQRGEIQTLAYWTVIGRIDQFSLGIVAYHLSVLIRARHTILLLLAGCFFAFWQWFNYAGGFYDFPSYPSSSALWIFLPTIEGISYAAFIAWYDGQEIPANNILSKLLQKLGEYSYSIYLLHFFIVFKAAKFVHENVMDISNFYVAMVWSIGFFILMIIPGYLSFKYIESPFLMLRRSYVR